MQCPSCQSEDIRFVTAGPVGGWVATCESCDDSWTLPSSYDRPWVAGVFLVALVVLPGLVEAW